MLKHKLIIRPSVWPTRVTAILTTLLILSVWLWQPYWFEGQVWIQILLSLLLVVVGLRAGRGQTEQRLAWLDESGRWQWPEAVAAGEPDWQMTPSSRLGPGVIWLQLKRHLSSDVTWLTLYKDSFTEDEYRLVCRTVRRIQQKEYHDE